MREVVARTARPGRWVWLIVVAQGLALASWVPRLGGEERGLAVLFVCASALLIVMAVVVAAVDLRATLVLTDEALLAERRWRALRVARDGVLAVDGNIHGRPSWSESVVLTVAGRDRPVRLSGLDVHARVLIPRLQEWAEVGDTAPASEDSASPN
jgi:hypothetical protein